MSIISDSLKRIKPSPTIAVAQKARELREERHQGKLPTSFTVDLVD